jgi:hypothetical protein
VKEKKTFFDTDSIFGQHKSDEMGDQTIKK